jgi:hypothetical protein
MRFIFFCLLFFISTLSAQEAAVETLLPEYTVQYLYLTGELNQPESEISGLCWKGDSLILVLQYPHRFGQALFYLTRSDLELAINGDFVLEPQPLWLTSGHKLSALPGYQGLEAMAIKGNRVFMLVEAEQNRVMSGYLLSGKIKGDSMEIDTDHYAEIPPQTSLRNYAEEALLLDGERVITFYEANGKNINPNPVAHVFTTNLEPAGTLIMPNFEYRLTDVTQPDSGGYFYGINYLYPGDERKLKLAPDEISRRWGNGLSHRGNKTVERIIRFRLREGRIELAETAPILLKLNGESRNWEGIARWSDQAFLMVTDTHPATILGLVRLR